MTAAAISAGDTAWVLVSSALVLLMVPGLALFYAGLVRPHAAVNTVLMSVAALAAVSVQWLLIGYSLAFGPGAAIGDSSWFGLAGVGAEPGPYGATIPHLAFSAFQAMFAGITVGLISGAVAERMRFSVFLIFAVAWTTLVYDPLAHWIWATDGWLRALGALDFAGGTVVHISAGTAALVVAAFVGPRHDAGGPDRRPHNVVFTTLGAALLWVGWFGFNAGSALAADGVAANAFATTHAAAAAAMVTWLVIELAAGGKATGVGAATGVVVGLVAITPAAGYVTPAAALVIGMVAATVSNHALRFRHRLRVDDALDVFACHGVAGIIGALLTGVFATTTVNTAGANGLLAGNPHLLWVQALAIVATIGFTAPVTALVMVCLRAAGSFRVSREDEAAVGVDIAEHGERAYSHDLPSLGEAFAPGPGPIARADAA